MQQPLPSIDTLLAADSIVHVLRARAAATPGRQAFSFWQDGEEESAGLTYARLERRAAALAAGLLQRFAPGDRLLLAYGTGPAFVEAFFACLWARIVAVPVALPLPGKSADPIAAVLRRTGARAVLTAQADLRWLERCAPTGGWQGALLPTDGIEGTGGAALPLPDADGTAFLQCTSGSTSQPKAVVIRHGNLMANSRVIRERFGHGADSQGVIWLPHYHDMGLIGGILQPVAVGFPVVLMPPHIFVQQPKRWLRAVSKTRATTSGGPPFAFAACVRRFADADLAQLDLSRWSAAFVGAEPVGARTLHDFARRFAACGFRADALLPCYGLAEATLMVSGGPGGLRERGGRPPAEGTPGRLHVACGEAAPGHEVRVVDPETRRVQPDGVEGEIWVRGPSVAAGYWDDPQETARVFGARLAPGAGGGAFLRTGDLGFLEDGELAVTGRLKDLIIVRGRNLHPQDVEDSTRHVVHAHGELCAAAFGVDVEGDEELVVVQEVPAQGGGPAGMPEWEQRIAQAILQAHGVRCHEIVFVRRKTIPRTTSGKVMRGSCRQMYLSRALEPFRASGSPAASPDTEARHAA